MKVLVTDGHSRAALQIVRSLGKLGLEVHVSEKFSINPSFFSNYASKSFVYPNPNDEESFVNSIKDYCIKNKIKIIFPVVDECLLAIVKHRHIFENVIIPFADYDKIEIFRDKLKTVKLCEKLKIPHPKTFFSDNPDFEDIAKKLKYPILLKPRRGSGSRGIKVVKNLIDFESSFGEVKSKYGTPLIQQFIPHGGACGTEMLFSNEGLVASFSHYRIREYPISGGPSTFRRPIKSKLLNTLSEKILKEVDWYGPAMVEYRIDSRTNYPMLMEVNGRYWGSLDCSIQAGIDFPKYHFKISNNQEVSISDYKLDVMSRWEIGDILWLFSNDKGFFNTLPQFLRGIGSNKFDYLKSDDPLPFIVSFIEAAGYLFSKEGREYSVNRGW